MVPKMSTISTNLFSQTRSALLALLYGHTDESFYQRQLIRTIGAGHGAIQRELKQLMDMGLIVRKLQGNQVLYRANTKSPIFAEIKSLITKTAGVHNAIRSALAPLESQIEVAFVFGSVARQEERAGSDVDLMILGDVSFSDIVAALAPAQKMLGARDQSECFCRAGIPLQAGSRKSLLAQRDEREETLRAGLRA